MLITHLTDKGLLALLFLLLSLQAGAQINIQTTFKPASPGPLDFRDTIPTLGDTSISIIADFLYDGQKVWVADTDTEYRYVNGVWVESLKAGLSGLAGPNNSYLEKLDDGEIEFREKKPDIWLTWGGTNFYSFHTTGIPKGAQIESVSGDGWSTVFAGFIYSYTDSRNCYTFNLFAGGSSFNIQYFADSLCQQTSFADQLQLQGTFNYTTGESVTFNLPIYNRDRTQAVKQGVQMKGDTGTVWLGEINRINVEGADVTVATDGDGDLLNIAIPAPGTGPQGEVGPAGPQGVAGDDATNYWTLSGSDIYRTTGDVGIGLTVPTAKLDVFGDSRFVGTMLYQPTVGNSISGMVSERLFYSGSNFLVTRGSLKSSGKAFWGYGVEPSLTVNNGLISSANNVAWERNAMTMGSDDWAFSTFGGGTSVAIGSPITLTDRFGWKNSKFFIENIPVGTPVGFVGYESDGDIVQAFPTLNYNTSNYTIGIDGSNTIDLSPEFVAIGQPFWAYNPRTTKRIIDVDNSDGFASAWDWGSVTSTTAPSYGSLKSMFDTNADASAGWGSGDSVKITIDIDAKGFIDRITYGSGTVYVTMYGSYDVYDGNMILTVTSEHASYLTPLVVVGENMETSTGLNVYKFVVPSAAGFGSTYTEEYEIKFKARENAGNPANPTRIGMIQWVPSRNYTGPLYRKGNNIQSWNDAQWYDDNHDEVFHIDPESTTVLTVTGDISTNGQIAVEAGTSTGHVLRKDQIDAAIATAISPLGPVWSENGADVYRSSGEVGIGLTNPATRLNLLGTASTTANFLRFNADQLNYQYSGGIEMMESTGYFGQSSNYGGRMYYDGTANLLRIEMANSTTVTSAISIKRDGGLVGIANTNPLYPLDVTGTLNATSFRGDGSLLTNLPLDGNGIEDGGDVAVPLSTDVRGYSYSGSGSFDTRQQWGNLSSGNYVNGWYTQGANGVGLEFEAKFNSSGVLQDVPHFQAYGSNFEYTRLVPKGLTHNSSGRYFMLDFYGSKPRLFFDTGANDYYQFATDEKPTTDGSVLVTNADGLTEFHKGMPLQYSQTANTSVGTFPTGNWTTGGPGGVPVKAGIRYEFELIVYYNTSSGTDAGIRMNVGAGTLTGGYTAGDDGVLATLSSGTSLTLPEQTSNTRKVFTGYFTVSNTTTINSQGRGVSGSANINAGTSLIVRKL